MEGYRTSLILASAEFDTYKVIAGYARSPRDTALFSGFRYLIARTETRIKWDVSQLGLPETAVPLALHLRTGMEYKDTATVQEKRLDDMTEKERAELYAEACKAAGISIDPSNLVRSGNI